MTTSAAALTAHTGHRGKPLIDVITRTLFEGYKQPVDPAKVRTDIKAATRDIFAGLLADLNAHPTRTHYATVIAEHFGGVAPIAIGPMGARLNILGSIPLAMAIDLIAGHGGESINQHWTKAIGDLQFTADIRIDHHDTSTNDFRDHLLVTLEQLERWCDGMPIMARHDSFAQIKGEAKTLGDGMLAWLESIVQVCQRQIAITPMALATGAAVSETNASHNRLAHNYIALDQVKAGTPKRSDALMAISLALNTSRSSHNSQVVIVETNDTQITYANPPLGKVIMGQHIPVSCLHWYDRHDVIIEEGQAFIPDTLPLTAVASLPGQALGSIIDNVLIAPLGITIDKASTTRFTHAVRSNWINVGEIYDALRDRKNPDGSMKDWPDLKLGLKPQKPYVLTINQKEAWLLANGKGVCPQADLHHDQYPPE